LGSQNIALVFIYFFVFGLLHVQLRLPNLEHVHGLKTCRSKMIKYLSLLEVILTDGERSSWQMFDEKLNDIRIIWQAFLLFYFFHEFFFTYFPHSLLLEIAWFSYFYKIERLQVPVNIDYIQMSNGNIVQGISFGAGINFFSDLHRHFRNTSAGSYIIIIYY
jgi:hypothetical protein